MTTTAVLFFLALCGGGPVWQMWMPDLDGCGRLRVELALTASLDDRPTYELTCAVAGAEPPISDQKCVDYWGP